jgi:hypothetical protein
MGREYDGAATTPIQTGALQQAQTIPPSHETLEEISVLDGDLGLAEDFSRLKGDV